MKKINVFLALLAVLLMVMTGCGGGGNEGVVAEGTGGDIPGSIQLITPKDGSTAVVDPDKGFISGLKPELTKEELEADYIDPAPAGYHFEYEPDNGVLGTGTKVKVVEDGTGKVVETYTIIIYGDINGDGRISALDSLMVLHQSSGTANWDPDTQGYLFEAGDVNGNDLIDQDDAEMILDVASGLWVIDQVTGLADAI